MVNYNPNSENIVNANVSVVINDELSNFTTKKEVISFFKDSLNYEEVSVSDAVEVK